MSSHLTNPLIWISVGLALPSVVIITWFLARRPPIDVPTKLILFLGVFVLPGASAMTGNLVGFEYTSERDFCGSCHVMEPWFDDIMDPESRTLAALHSRNELFGHRSCYTCHADYEMFGLILTKMGGMGHVYYYYLGGWMYKSTDEVLEELHLSKSSFPNTTCMTCHSTYGTSWDRTPDHKGVKEDVRDSLVTCASRGCHGPAHPFSKLAKGEVLAMDAKGRPLAPQDESSGTSKDKGVEP